MNDSTVVGDAKILATDISSGNGVIHAIDTVLITWLLASLDPITKWSDYLVNVLVAIFVINNFNFLKMTINVVKNLHSWVKIPRWLLLWSRVYGTTPHQQNKVYTIAIRIFGATKNSSYS